MIPHGFGPIFRRELRSFLHSDSTYIALGLLFLLTGVVYHDIIVSFVDLSQNAINDPVMTEAPNITIEVVEATFQMIAGTILIAIPILTMRLISAERAQGTFEVLVTSPVSDWGILLGKYAALVTVGAIMVLLSMSYPICTWFLGRSAQVAPEPAVVLTSALGLFLIFCTYSAFGLMASAFTTSQVTAAIVTLIGLIGWNVIGELPVSDPKLLAIISEVSASHHTSQFISGIVSLRDLAFFVLSSAAFLFVAARMLEVRRWKI